MRSARSGRRPRPGAPAPPSSAHGGVACAACTIPQLWAAQVPPSRLGWSAQLRRRQTLEGCLPVTGWLAAGVGEGWVCWCMQLA